MSTRDMNRDEDYKKWLEHGFRRGYIKPNSRDGGPKVRRSDNSIESEIHDKLTHNKDLDASDISVDVRNGDVTLKGFIDDKYQKRLAEDLVLEIPGVRDVINLLSFKQFGFQPHAQRESLPQNGSESRNVNNDPRGL